MYKLTFYDLSNNYCIKDEEFEFDNLDNINTYLDSKYKLHMKKPKKKQYNFYKSFKLISKNDKFTVIFD